VEGQGDLLVAQELVDLLGVDALELGAVRAGVVEVDVQDGGRGGDGVESGALAVGPGGVREDLLGDAVLTRLRGGQALVRCGELRALGLLLGVDAEVGQVAEPAAQGDADAQNNLGGLYARGDGVKKDLKKAREWLEKAAAQGNENARRTLLDLKEQ